MEKTVLIIDDERGQAEALTQLLQEALPDVSFICEHEEDSITRSIEEKFFSLAIVDIRMDKYKFDGLELVETIFEKNPFAKVIIVSFFKDEYFSKIKKLLLTGKIIDVLEKESLKTWIPKLKDAILNYYELIDRDPSEINKALLEHYALTKNESDAFKKGLMFEHFISLLFNSFGFKEIFKRVIDKSRNEVDLVIRNEIDDRFLMKFGKYILIECKNKPDDPVSKNDFIVFRTKLENTAGLSDLGIVATSSYIAKTTYLEALRDSKGAKKVIFMSNPEIEKLINSKDKLEEFKRLIDSQVKDN